MKKIIVLLIIIIFISGCEKYPDGPLLSLHSRTERVVGKWDVEYYEVNGVDSTDYLKSQPFFGFLTFEYDNGYKNFVTGSSPYLYSGGWGFENSDKDLAIANYHYEPVPFQCGPYAAPNAIWTILRLKEKSMWLRTFYNHEMYLLKLKQ